MPPKAREKKSRKSGETVEEKAVRLLVKKLERDPTLEEIAKKVKALEAKALQATAKAAAGGDDGTAAGTEGGAGRGEGVDEANTAGAGVDGGAGEDQVKGRGGSTAAAGAGSTPGKKTPPGFKELVRTGRKAVHKGDFKRGVQAFTHALKAAQGQEGGVVCAVYAQLGQCFQQLGDIHKALYCYKTDMTLSRKRGDRMGECRAFRNLGDAFKAKGIF
jgi:hypothetical protein